MTISGFNSKIVRIEIVWKQIGSCSFGNQRGTAPYLYVENSVSSAKYIPRGGLSPVIRYDILSAELYDCPFRMSCNRGAVRYFVYGRKGGENEKK